MEAERRTPKPPRATGGEKPAGSHRAPTRRKRSGKPSHAEARAACMRVMQEMFDLPAVLRGRKPVSQLAGLVPLAGWLTCVGVSMAVTVLNDRTMQQLQRSLYLRNFGVFARDMMLRISAVIADISLQSMQQYFRVRVAYGWRQQLQDKLHATYFNNMTYYRQTTWDNSISDPGQRITRDIGMLAFQLRVFCTSLVYETLRTIQTCTRIWFALPNERWLIPLILAWTWTNLAVRNFLVPALERGLLMAKINRVEGAFRDAHSKLAQHAESIICFDGVSVEAERLQGRLDERLGLARKMMILGMKERGTMEVLGMIVSQALTSCLVQVPMLSSSYHLKVSPNASEQLRMQANANMLAAMQFNEQLVRSLQMCVGHLSRLGRDVMGVSGSAIRIAELLDLINSENTGQPCATEDIAMCFREVDVETPTGVRLIDRLSFTVSKGENLLLTGANGCGKTSILRTLKGLWRPASGTAGFPRGTVFVPQSPYCPTGSLQDQLSYPDILKTAMPSDELRQHLSKVKLAHLVDKELDDPSTDWNLLSLAEKQLLGVARVLFKNPTFAVFDEATSAVDAELEAELFQQLRHAGTTLFTVTHRASLLQYHDKILKIVGGEERSWSLKAIEAGDENALASPRLTPVSRPAAQTHADTDTEVARHLAGRSKKEGAESLAHRPMPKVSDVHKTWMILKLCIPRLTVTDSTVVRLIVFVALMGAGTWIQSGFLASSYGVLKALTMESNPEKYVRFQLQIAGMRIVSLGISLVQQWVQSDVALTWRRRITETITSRYLANGNFYAMRHVDRRITDVDNRIAVEVTQLVSAMSQMTWMILRPVLDAVYCTVLLVRAQLPAVALFTMFAYGIGGVSLIRLAAPDFKKMTQEKERVQAELRSAHERVEQNAEAIAFQDGDSAEERIANKACGSVMSFLHRENAQDSWWSAFNSFVMWRLTYYIQMSLQFFWSLGQGTDTDVLADRGGVQMAETSSYIGSLIQQSLSSLSSLLSMWGGYQMGGQGGQQGPSGIAGLLGSSRRVAEVLLVLDDLDQQREAAANRLSEIELPATPRRGERICLSGASINSPDGQCLASQLTFSVEEQRGDETDLSSLLITGKTGSGKSSVARVLHGIWLPGTGRVGMPSGLATIPQSPLVPTGSLSLMSMLTYPKEFAAGSDDADATAAVLLPLMQRLRVAYLIERNEQGWHEIKDWPNVLSLGEQQCLGVIRVMYHGCEWLLLDEATSAMGEDVAAECYRIFEERGRHFGSAMYSTSIDLSLKLRLLSSCQSICTQLVPVLCARLHGSGAGIRYVTVSQDSDAYRAFHSQELRLGEPNPRGWTLEKIFRLDAPGCGDEEEMDLVLPSASEICPDISEGQMESGSDAGGSDRV